MIRIDDAGTGCMFGKGIIVGYRDDTGEIISKEINDKVEDICMNILKELNHKKEEPIEICRGDMFKSFVKKIKNEGYNITSVKIEGELQDIAENEFINQLHCLGFSESIKLHERDYKRLQLELIDNLYFKPHLIKHLRKSAYKTKSINKVIYSINRLTNEFPHLYAMLLEA